MLEKSRYFADVEKYYGNYRFDSLITRTLRVQIPSGSPQNEFLRVFEARGKVLKTEIGRLIFTATQGDSISLLRIINEDYNLAQPATMSVSASSRNRLPRLFMTAVDVRKEIAEQRKRNKMSDALELCQEEETLVKEYEELGIQPYKPWELRKQIKQALD